MHGYQGFVLLGGYAAAVGLLVLGVRWQEKADAYQDHRRRKLAGFAYAACGLAASATTYYWVSQVWSPVALVVLFGVLPALFGLWIWWRGFAQTRWMDRLAARGRGQHFSGQTTSRPAFGVLPGMGRARRPEDGGVGFEAAVAVRTHGLEVLGVQYLHMQPPAGTVGLWRGTLAKISDLDGTFSMVQVRTPDIPALVIRPRSGLDRKQSHGAQAGRINAFDDARLTRNMLGAPHPSAATEPLELDGEFGKWFEVRAQDPQLAAAALTPQVKQALLDDPWFRLGAVVFADGVLWTTRFGRLTESALFDTSRRLTALAALLPASMWSDPAFATALGAADTSAGNWGSDTAHRRRRSLVDKINGRRAAALRTPVSGASLAIRLIGVLALALWGGYWVTNPVFAWRLRPTDAEQAFDNVMLPIFGLAILLLAYRLIRPLWPSPGAPKSS